MNKKVISLLFSNYKNDNRVFKMATTLSDNNYEVTVLGLLYGDVVENETQGKISVKRIKLKSSILPSGNKIFGSIKYLEFFYRIIKNYRKADIWHCNDFKPFLVGVIARFFNSKLKLVYDCHELESETRGISYFEKKLTLFIEKKYGNSAKVITVGESIQNIYIERNNLRKENTEIIYNVPHYNSSSVKPEQIFRNTFNIPLNEKIFIYQGGLVEGRGIPILIDTFKGLGNIHAVFMGFGKYEDEILEAEKEYKNIHFQEAVPYHEVMKYTASADFGMVSTENVCLNHYYCMPNKLFEYTQAEIPILVNALKDCTQFVEENGIGMAVKEETIESWKETVIAMSKTDKSSYLENLKKAKKNFNWENEEKKLIAFYDKID